MKTTKKLLLLIFAVAMLISIFAMPAYAASTTNQTGGTAGTWNYTLSNGNATNVYCSSALSGVVTIPSALDGYPVISINGASSTKNMFNVLSNTSVTSITIPNSVTSIGNSAFYNCRGLTSITIPNSVTSIGERAFQNCTSLISITIPSSVTSIGNYAFYGCTGLTSMTIPNSVTSIGTYAFRGCTGLTSITIPNSVTSIGDSAFQNCTSVTSVTIPNSVTTIGRSAFNSCSSLTSITIPNSVTSIGDYAFQGCTGLTSITIPNSVTSVGTYAFLNVPSVVMNSTKTILYHIPETYTSYTIPNSVTSIGDYAFYNCTGLTSITIPNSVTSIGTYAFRNCTSLTSVTIPNSVTSIGDYAFDGCTGLTSITIPNSVTFIGYSAFSGCTSLTSITIPNSVTSIGDRAFYNCTGLTSITIPNSVTSIGERAFQDCTSLTSVTIPNSVTSIGNSAFNGCTGLTSITIPNSVTSVGRYAFYGCTSLTSVTIPNSVTSIGDYAFNFCTGLTSVTIPDSITSIGEYAFSGCSSLTSVTIPNSVTSIGNYAFRNCTGLTSVTIPNSVTSIGRYAFQGCTSVTSVTIPNSVTSIGRYAFQGCTSVTSITIPNSVTSIEDGAFFNIDKNITTIKVASGSYAETYMTNEGFVNILAVAPPNKPVLSASTTNPTNGNIIITVNYSEDSVTKQYKIGSEGTWINYTTPITLTTNNTVYAKAIDIVGNVVENILTVTNIDKLAPVITIAPYNTNPTNQDVVVNVATNEGILNASSHAFTNNGSFEFVATDEAGNVTKQIVTITNIDKVAPIITIAPYNTNSTNQDITVTATTDKGTLNTSSHTFTENGSFEFVATDEAGNVAKQIITVTNIDKVAPIITIAPYNTNSTNQDITVTATTDKGTLNTSSHTFTENSSFEFIATDGAGNVAKQTVTITNIDKTAPTTPAVIIFDYNILTINGSTDDESGLSRCLYQLNGDEWITYADTVTLADGQYQISAKAIDIAGNESSITTINYHVFKTALGNATNTVSIVENNKNQEDLDTARTLVNTLPDSDEKTALIARLDALQMVIDEEIAVNNATQVTTIAETSKKQEDIDTARALVNALPDSSEKTNLINRLNTIITPETSVVIQAVEKAERYPSNRNYIIDALNKATALPDSAPQKADLVTRATALKDAYNNAIDEAKYADSVSKATRYVEQSEKYTTNYYMNKAQEYINLLREDDTVRIELQARLDAVKDKIALAELTKAIQDATKAVENAEKYRKASYVDKAQPLIEALPDIAEKQALQDRLDVIILK